MTWFDDAACKGQTDLFFIDEGGSYAQALELCATCPVVDECALYAVSTRQRYGVWGGLTPKQRGLGRSPITECPHGHLYDDVNTRWDSDGHRRCRECASNRHRTARKVRVA
jgi:WhiB family redox-sensing transcriptional regulator